MNTIPTYLIIGTPGSGRRGVIWDVIQKALGDDDFCGVFISENEAPAQSDKRIASAQNAGIIRYRDADDAIEKIAALDKEKFSQIFFFADASRNLADDIEDFKRIVDAGDARLARIWGVLDCGLLAARREDVQPYADALSHFSDCLLLSRREGLQNREVAEIKSVYEKQCKPHMFEYVDKDFHVKHPIEMMIEEARRISMVFDPVDPVDELDIDEDNLPEEPFSLERKPDPYLERLPNGLRKKPIPDLSKIAASFRAQK